MPEPTIRGRFPKIFFKADWMGAFKGGTTEETMLPSIWLLSMP